MTIRDRISAFYVTVVSEGLHIDIRFIDRRERRESVIPLELKNDMELRLPLISSLTALDSLSINNDTDYDIRFDTDSLCGLDSLAVISFRNIDIYINNSECIALPNLRMINIEECAMYFSEDNPYDNIVQLLAANAPNVQQVYLTNNYNIEGEWTLDWISNSMNTLRLLNNDGMPNLNLDLRSYRRRRRTNY